MRNQNKMLFSDWLKNLEPAGVLARVPSSRARVNQNKQIDARERERQRPLIFFIPVLPTLAIFRQIREIWHLPGYKIFEKIASDFWL